VDDRDRECRSRMNCGDSRSDNCLWRSSAQIAAQVWIVEFSEKSDPEFLVQRDAVLLAIAHVVVDEPEDVERLE